MRISTNLVMPNDLNPHGTLFGGKLMADMDKAAALAVIQHTGMECVTLKVSEILFKVPIYVDDIYTIDCEVEKVGTTSITISVIANVRHPFLDIAKVKEAARASFVMVTISDDGKPLPHEKTIEDFE